MLSPALESKKEGAQTMCLVIISGLVCCTRRRSPIVVQFSGQKKARVCLIINRQYHSDHSVNNDDDVGDKYEDVPNYHHHHLCSQQ